MLEQLSKRDEHWRKIAFSICKNKQLADDLTNDMYIYFSDKNIEVTDWYVYRKIKNLYLNHLRDKKEYCFIESDISIFIELYGNANNDVTEQRKIINNALNELDYYDRELLLHTSERSLRDNEKYLNELDPDGKPLTVRVIRYARINALEKLKNTETIKNYNNERT